MAGLGETCTHVAALLFATETMVKLRDSKTVTQEKAYWLLPSCRKNVDYKECKDIDFTSARTLKKKLDQKVDALDATGDSRKDVLSKKKFRARTPYPTEEEVNDLFKSLAIGGAKREYFHLLSHMLMYLFQMLKVILSHHFLLISEKKLPLQTMLNFASAARKLKK